MNEPVNRDALMRLFPNWVVTKYSNCILGQKKRGKFVVSKCAFCGPDDVCAGASPYAPHLQRADYGDNISGTIKWR